MVPLIEEGRDGRRRGNDMDKIAAASSGSSLPLVWKSGVAVSKRRQFEYGDASADRGRSLNRVIQPQRWRDLYPGREYHARRRRQGRSKPSTVNSERR